MPNYKWLVERKINYRTLSKKLSAMKQLGIPYSDTDISSGVSKTKEQAKVISEDLMNQGVPKEIEDKELVALIAYLQRMGTDYSNSEATK